jgi:hypothetical protein
LDSRLKMRNLLIPFFPKDLVTMKSGKGTNRVTTCTRKRTGRKWQWQSTVAARSIPLCRLMECSRHQCGSTARCLDFLGWP